MERLDVPTDEASDLVRFGVSPHRHCRGERRLKLRGIARLDDLEARVAALEARD